MEILKKNATTIKTVMPYFSSAVITVLAQKVDIKIGHKQASLFSYLRMCHLYPDQRER